MERVLVSACLLGCRVRYSGSDARIKDAVLERWVREGRVVVLCPEVAGGLPVPRPPAEIRGGDGHAVLDGTARVVDRRGRDVTAFFVEGARLALGAVRESGVRVAVLKQKSPSCGSRHIYDGRFGGRLREGVGVAAALLERSGVRVFGEDEVAEADRYLRGLERGGDGGML
ncbi:hypothetical protein Rxycam_02952 [Rubrobacter xylanophilus DSM 9941]|uniref:DUF523 domain-containing protein n=1 Tax=Rubrobacter xylanophilus TaxID=49319 RepID=UPI001C643878|nr:DUF523 domain-containing protein [Rubrobacter xylanophilus]QYJ17114.1 hypothetical protein Rxycam_02952 [Rubrobacter xylanophilus DSM 9941]